MRILGLNKSIIRALFSSQYAYMNEYRAEILLWSLSGVLPFIMLAIWTNSDAARNIGFKEIELSKYFLCAFLVRQFSVVWLVKAFEQDSLLGRISPYLLQPLQPLWRYVATHLAEQATRLPFVILITSIFFILNPESFWIPKLWHLMFAWISTWLAFAIGFLMHALIASLCFWNEKASALERLIGGAFPFLSGFLAPISAFPDSFQKFVFMTPFPYMIDFPARLLAGLEVNIIQGFFAQFIWVIILLPIVLFLWKLGVRRYTAMGA